jgi:hypothetical protein
VFSSSSVFSRLISETASPPNLASIGADAVFPAQVGN